MKSSSRAPSPAAYAKALSEMDSWLKNLPLADTEQAARSLQARIGDFSNSSHPAELQVALLEHALPVIDDLCKRFIKAYQTSSAQMARTQHGRVTHLSNLLITTSRTYSQCFGRMVMGQDNDEERLIASFRAMGLLADRCLFAYRFYRAIPKGMWAEIHHWVQLARRSGLHNQVIPKEHRRPTDPAQPSIENLYKRLLVIASANPLNLQRGDVDQLLMIISPWSQQVVLEPATEATFKKSDFLLDPNVDAPPFPWEEDQPTDDANLYRLNFQSIIQQSQGRLKSITLFLRDTPDAPLASRRERDLLLRACRFWGAAMERRFQRKQLEGIVEVAPGVGTAHSVLSDEEDFDPRPKEQQLEADCEPFTEVEKEYGLTILEHDEEYRENNNFLWEESSDSWDWNESSLILEQSKEAPKERKGPHIEFPTSKHRLLDISKTGLAMEWRPDVELAVSVGDMAAARIMNPDGDYGSWFLAVVQWMEDLGNGSSRIGLRQFAKSAVPCALRSTAGKTPVFRRALLTPGPDPTTPNSTLLVPSGIFTIGEPARFILPGLLVICKLTGMRAANKHFSQFTYEVERICASKNV